MTIKTNYKKELKTKKGANYNVAHAGPLADLHQFEIEHPRLKRNVPKFFLKDELELTGMQVSLNRMPAGASVPFYHKHKQNEELYIFVKGKGQMQIDGDIIEVSEGTSIRISPNGERTWRNTGTEDLYCICIQAKENSLSQETFEDGIPVEREVTWP